MNDLLEDLEERKLQPTYGREAGGYQWMTDGFQVLHTCSSPVTDEDAVAMFATIQSWFPWEKVTYILKRGHNEYTFKMMPFKYDSETGEVTRIGAGS